MVRTLGLRPRKLAQGPLPLHFRPWGVVDRDLIFYMVCSSGSRTSKRMGMVETDPMMMTTTITDLVVLMAANRSALSRAREVMPWPRSVDDTHKPRSC